MTLKELIGSKGHEVICGNPATSVLDAVKMMVENKVGSLLITDGTKPLGIFTERDLLRIVAEGLERVKTLTMQDVMSKNLIIGRMDDKVESARAVMIEKKVRHLPIMDRGKVAGIISIGDTVKAALEDIKSEAHYLEDYILGKY